MAERFDDIVVGSGVSGLTAALLLGLNGRRVLVVEKAPEPGGSLKRFRRNGVDFDTGFHFTGGWGEHGLLQGMLSALEIGDAVRPVFLSDEAPFRFVFESEGRTLELPRGVPAARRKLKSVFPGETRAVDGYFDRLEKVCAGTATMNLRNIGLSSDRVEEDFVSLREVLDGLTDNRLLKGVVSAFCMCYGAKPSEVSFANHSRVSLGLHERTVRIEDGGTGFIRAFQNRLKGLDVEVRCGRHIVQCVDIEDQKAGRVVLNTGEEIGLENCISTVHPRETLNMLPREHLTKAFVNRVMSLEPSAGFFTVFGVLEDGRRDAEASAAIVSLYPTTDFDAMLDPAREGDSALIIVESDGREGDRPVRTLTAFEPSFPEHVAPWKDSTVKHRPPGYAEYKSRRTARIRERLAAFRPEYRDGLRVLDAASLLTFRDYLHSPDGSAYGVKQKLGQISLLGKLPIRNVYAAGQSSLLPGVLGAMMSSFIVCRAVIGKDQLSRFVSRRT